jgi:hypothetical protein
MELRAAESMPTPSGTPHWIEAWLNVKPGRDPLGLMTITQDRILPGLLPGILVLSERARYLSYYAFLLSEYERHKLPAVESAQSDYIRRREYELGVALELCPRGCGAPGLVGRMRTGPAVRALDGALERGESVESFRGGYGLYYRTPLAELGIVVRAGAVLGEEATPVDLLARSTRAEGLAQRFRSAIEDTAYYREHMRATGPIPRSALEELAARACLCRLDDFGEERAALREAIFDAPNPESKPAFDQRRRSFALFLVLLDREPAVGSSDSAFRRAAIELFEAGSAAGELADAVSEWSALAMKECFQEALSSVWHATCAAALANQPRDGYTSGEFHRLVGEQLCAAQTMRLEERAVEVVPDQRTHKFQAGLVEAAAPVGWEALREWVASEDSAIAGLAAILVMASRLPRDAGERSAWTRVAMQVSSHQAGLLPLARLLDEHLADGPTVAETLDWLIRTAIIRPHETIAYGKLRYQRDFTFRFRWEEGRLRFYDNGVWRFDLADPRRNSMARISRDLGLWSEGESGAELTDDGRAFSAEVLS